MSETNGTARTPVEQALREARQQLRLEKARAELTGLRAANYSAHRLLQEGYDGYSGYAFGDLVDPMDAFRDADLARAGFPFVDRGYMRRDGYNRPFVWSDLDLDLYRSQARWIATRNMLGIGILSRLTNYTIKTGYKWEAAPRKGVSDPVAPELAEQVTAFLRVNHKVNDWPQRERAIFHHSRRDGEAFIRHFPQPDGTTWVRAVWPEQIVQPLGSPISVWAYGIRTDPEDIERHISYAVSYHHPADWDEIPAAGDEMMQLKLNVDECVKRGLSDFYSTGDALDATLKLIRNMTVSGGVQAALAWFEQFTGPNASTVQAAVQARRDQNRPEYANPISGQVTNYERYQPGSVKLMGSGREIVPAPQAVGASVHIQIVQAALRSIGARWDMPEYMVSGDASNANYASTLVAGSPFVNSVECEQDRYRAFFERSQWVAIRHAANSGLFAVNGRRFSAREVEALLEVHGTPPQVAIADEGKEAEIDHKDLAAGIVSKQHLRAKRGYDPEKIKQDLEEEPVGQPQAGPQQQRQAPGAEGAQQGQGPFFPRLARPA